MGSLPYLKYLLVMVLLLYSRAIAIDDPSNGFHRAERDALNALKATFNNTFVTKNWTHIPCHKNEPSKWYGIRCLNGRVTGISLDGIGLTGKVNVDALVNLTELSFLSFQNNSISGYVMDFSSNKKLTHINLSENKFYGPISASLLSLNLLETLLLQDNNLTGPIPEFEQSSLREFNVSNNNLSGPIPTTQALESFSFSSYVGNPELCGPPSTTACNTSNNDASVSGGESTHSISHFANIFAIVDVIGLVVVVLLFILYCGKARKMKKEMKQNKIEEDKKDKKKIEVEERRVVAEEKEKLIFMDDDAGFELGDLLKASAEGLGKGSFGNCYKAILDVGAVVVKRLRELKPLSCEEFTKQLRVIADQKHPNLLPLLAYYYSKDEKLLMYKFAMNGNLFNRIQGSGRGKDRIPFRWSSRLSVARGVGRALEFLHRNTKSQTTVPHGNLKSSNVLLDENEIVLVSDYGLTSLIALPIAAQQMVSYKSPEYQNYNKVSKKSDVWSYGCLLLELLTGRVSSHSAPPGINSVDLCSWVHRAVREEWTAEIFDPEISVQRSAAYEMLRLLKIAIRCCNTSPEKRPEMTEVVRELENLKTIDSEDDDDLSPDRPSDQSLTDDSP